ncbi:MAG: hypothetical protein JWQ55_900, partial [Rhodopila sp.]|nr:hypothetical protein [Rhodopila sp.]
MRSTFDRQTHSSNAFIQYHRVAELLEHSGIPHADATNNHTGTDIAFPDH